MNLADVAERMMRKGIDIPTISDILDAEEADLITLRDSLDITIEREDVLEAMNRLSWSAYEKAMIILETGNPTVRLALIRMLLMMMRPQMGKQSPREMAGLITEFRDAIELGDDEEDDDELDPVEVGYDEAASSDAVN